MRFYLSLWAVCVAVQLSSVVSAPNNLEKRATVNDVANIGWATTNGGTTGGSGGTVTTVTTLAALTAAVAGDAKKIVIVKGSLSSTASEGVEVRPGANTSILGAAGATLTNIGIRIINTSNVIVRGLTISKVLAPTDAIGIQAAHNVWIDHNDLSSDMTHDKDFYDGLVDITHAADFITVSNNHLHDHWKTSLVGHSDSNGDEDTGHLTVTYVGNYWQNLNSRGPSYRFGTGHVFNNYYQSMDSVINTRDGAQVLVENNVFVDCSDAIFDTDDGFAVATGNDFGDSNGNTAPTGTISKSKIPYSYTLLATSSVVSSVTANAGAKVSFS